MLRVITARDRESPNAEVGPSCAFFVGLDVSVGFALAAPSVGIGVVTPGIGRSWDRTGVGVVGSLRSSRRCFCWEGGSELPRVLLGGDCLFSPSMNGEEVMPFVAEPSSDWRFFCRGSSNCDGNGDGVLEGLRMFGGLESPFVETRSSGDSVAELCATGVPIADPFPWNPREPPKEFGAIVDFRPMGTQHAKRIKAAEIGAMCFTVNRLTV